MSNQSLRQASISPATPAADETYETAWLRAFAAASTPGVTFNEKLLNYINTALTASYTNLNEAMHAYAVDKGADKWDSLGTFTP